MSEDQERGESLDDVAAVPVAADDASGADAESAGSFSRTAALHLSRNRQKQRIADYQANSLNKGDPLEANVGFINGDMMLLQSELHQAVIEVMRAPVDLNVLAEVSPALDTYLRVTKQIERFTQIERKFCQATGALPVTKQSGTGQSEETSS